MNRDEPINCTSPFETKRMRFRNNVIANDDGGFAVYTRYLDRIQHSSVRAYS